MLGAWSRVGSFESLGDGADLPNVAAQPFDGHKLAAAATQWSAACHTEPAAPVVVARHGALGRHHGPPSSAG